MRVGKSSVLKMIGRQAPTALVLVGLVGIGLWGSAHDWTVPKFSALFAKPAAPEEEPAVKVIPDPSAEKSPDSCARDFQNTRIVFASPEAVRRAGIRWTESATRSLAESVTANGVIDYHDNYIAHLTFPVQGFVWRVDKHLGEVVKAGEVLALVQSAEVGRAKAEFQEYLVLSHVKDKIFHNLTPGAAPSTTLQQAELAMLEARIRLVNAQQTLINLGLPVKIEDFEKLPEKDLIEKVRVLGLPAETVRTLKPDQVTSNLIPLLAPFDGVVVDKDMVKGEFVSFNNNMSTRKPHFTVADVRRMEVLLDVRQEDIGKVQLGQELTFRADGAPDVTAAGHTCWISSEADEKTRTIRIKAHVPNPDGKLRAHLFGTGRVLVHSVPDAVVVPDDAVQADDSCRMVFVRRSENEFQSRLVQTGIRADGYTQIVSGLKAGEEVATTGSHALKSEIVKGRIGEGE